MILIKLIHSPESLSVATFFSVLIGDAPGEIPKVTPLELLYLTVASFGAMTSRYDATLELAFRCTQVDDSVTLALVNGSYETGPEERFLFWGVSSKL